jgi:hypothetical protein
VHGIHSLGRLGAMPDEFLRSISKLVVLGGVVLCFMIGLVVFSLLTA